MSGAIRAAQARRGVQVAIRVGGRTIAAYIGETVATALLAAGYRALRTSPVKREPRGPFCLMGACQDCAVEIDGSVDLACQRLVRDGMAIVLERGSGP